MLSAFRNNEARIDGSGERSGALWEIYTNEKCGESSG